MGIAHELIIFDLDGTLVDTSSGFNSTDLMLDRIYYIKEFTNKGVQVAIATNQGGVGCRILGQAQGWKNWERYPTEDECLGRLGAITDRLHDILNKRIPIIFCFQFQDSKGNIADPGPMFRDNAEWSLTHRKPNRGMLSDLMAWTNVPPQRTLYVGDRQEDYLAAYNAGCGYTKADKFFSVPVPGLFNDDIPF
ncbi:HAD hydrolase-like protein [Virus Rctr71]|nr:HAD hydrolase-like protein [Virus Rctr71]